MAKKINQEALRQFVYRANLDAMLPFVDEAKRLGVPVGPTTLPALTESEIRAPLGSYNVRAFIDWLEDHQSVDGAIASAALSTISRRFPNLIEPASTDEASR